MFSLQYMLIDIQWVNAQPIGYKCNNSMKQFPLFKMNYQETVFKIEILTLHISVVSVKIDRVDITQNIPVLF